MKLTEEQIRKVAEMLEAHWTKKSTHQTVTAMSDIERIIQRVCETSFLSREELMRKSRKTHIVMPRTYAIYKVVEAVNKPICTFSLQVIGEIFAGMNHASIFQAHKRIANWLLVRDPETMKVHDRYNAFQDEPEPEDSILERAMLIIDDFLNAGSDEQRKEVAENAKYLYVEYYKEEYVNRNER